MAMIDRQTASTVGEFVAQLEPEFQPAAEALRSTIRRCAPSAHEAIKWRVPAYGERPVVAAIMPAPGYLRLELFQGADLDDPEGLLEGSGTAVRHIKVRTVDEAHSAPLAALVVQAFVRAGQA
jgi:hypothetical protein